MHLPCDVHHVVSWSGLLSCIQSFGQTHRCAWAGDVQRDKGCSLCEIKGKQYEKYYCKNENSQEVKMEMVSVFLETKKFTKSVAVFLVQ